MGTPAKQYYGVIYKEMAFSKKSSRVAKKPWQAIVQKLGKRYYCGSWVTEKEAALAVDKKLIELGYPPRNILKPQAK